MDVPDEVRRMSYAALDLHDPTIPVADLVYDSMLDAVGAALPRRLVFECRGHRERIRVDITSDGCLDVRLAPARGTDVTLVRPDGETPAQTDGRGRVRIGPLRPGLMSLVVKTGVAPESIVRTAWVLA